MQTVETPSKQPERSYPELMPVIDEQALRGAGFHIMRRMYTAPYAPFVFTSGFLSYGSWVVKIAELSVLGYVAYTSADNGGFQLTALGRLVFHNYYTDFLARIGRKTQPKSEPRAGFFFSHYTPDEIAMLEQSESGEPPLFDLLDF